MDTIDPLEALTSLAGLVRTHYLYADRAEELAAEIARWSDGDIAGLRSASELTEALTTALRTTTGDLHFKVTERVFNAAEQAAAPEDRWKHAMPGAAANFGFQSVEVTDGTALLTLTSLDYVKWSGPTALAAMNFAKHATRFVVDVRTCQGGDPDLIAMIAGHFLGDAPVELSTVHWRDGKIETLHSDPTNAAFQFGADVPLIVIIGPGTASGGEALADHLQATGRATVVGQTSIGAAHRIKEFQLVDGLVARIPSGWVENAFTGGDWESTGVTPDVVVEPESDPVPVAIASHFGDDV